MKIENGEVRKYRLIPRVEGARARLGLQLSVEAPHYWQLWRDSKNGDEGVNKRFAADTDEEELFTKTREILVKRGERIMGIRSIFVKNIEDRFQDFEFVILTEPQAVK